MTAQLNHDAPAKITEQNETQRQIQNTTMSKAANSTIITDIDKKRASSLSRTSTKAPKKNNEYIYNDEIDGIKKLIEKEKAKAVKLDAATEELNSKLLSYKKKQGGVNATQENYILIQKQIHILENRLGKANQKYSEAVAVNKKLRVEIENLRKERSNISNIYEKLNEELQSNRKNMADIINNASKAQTERVKAQDQLTKLIDNAKKDQNEFNTELEKINIISEKTKPLEDMLKSKEAEKNHLIKVNLIAQEKYEEANVKKKALMSGWGFGSNINAAMTFSKTIQSYEEMFAKIQTETSITDIDQLVHNFMQSEEKNYYLHKFVNDILKEIKELDRKIDEIRKELDSYNGMGINQTEAERSERINDITSKIEIQENKEEMLKQRSEALKVRSLKLKQAIEKLFNLLKSDDPSSKEPGFSENTLISSLTSQLEYIERRKTDVLLCLSELLNKNAHKDEGKTDKLAGNANVNELISSGNQINESLLLETKDYQNRESTKLKISSDELINTKSVEEFRNKIIAKIRMQDSGNSSAM